ncbi:MAG: type II secretion system protein GspE [Candidatus Wallbacteria bacterium HGW-Wallbacteria-1]|jgi:type IV pilus assembly protein PilB|uniref:Type II secretion system protein GspE n=1 Tax=Candidatus Wallbacteria bacterium HGW-Wallbacteria-1 TaxID=2013854 RepID=A0A2N1PQA7_9BACT|nr:MAG: type II secretion system protein GspE [Candidatus Wallbacteria bacterium HGW-Wallbacteria-1]
MSDQEKRLLGESLLEAGLVNRDQLLDALKSQRKSGHSLGYCLLLKGYISQEDLIFFLETKLGINYANLANYIIDPHVVKLVPKEIAVKYQVIPLVKVQNVLTVAMVDPLDSFLRDALKTTSGCEIKPLISTREEIQKAIVKYYDNSDEEIKTLSASDRLKALSVSPSQGTLRSNSGKTLDDLARETISGGGEKKAPVIELVDLIIQQAIRDGASDIHVEPDENVLRVRYRMDGILHEVMSLSKDLEQPIVSRIKIMANLDISEKRVPQDGRVNTSFENREIDLRVSTFPTILGEKAVLRILDRSSLILSLNDLGFSDYVLRVFSESIEKPTGIILVTGPTGSGKSTTLYSALDKINSLDRNIVTVEDPVEYHMPIINQSQVNPKAGYDFADGLRSILRQDPDIIMVGEIRDYATAETSIRAALTGHLVLSTLHTNDAPGAITRLVDMGVEPFLVASSIICIMAQRLVRMVCKSCCEPYTPHKEILNRLQASLDVPFLFDQGTNMMRGVGCPVCKHTGYKGRTCINEVFTPSEEIKNMIVSKRPTSEIKAAARRQGMKTLREDGLIKVSRGMTTIEEVMRVAYADD